MIANVIIHLHGELPIVADLDELPSGGDRSVRCTNVRTVDGKRPAFVHDRHSTFIFPLSVIRLIEAPGEGSAAAVAPAVPEPAMPPLPPPPVADEEPDEDLLARIRSV